MRDANVAFDKPTFCQTVLESPCSIGLYAQAVWFLALVLLCSLRFHSIHRRFGFLLFCISFDVSLMVVLLEITLLSIFWCFRNLVFVDSYSYAVLASVWLYLLRKILLRICYSLAIWFSNSLRFDVFACC
jgi:hypothetical protein